MSHISPNLQHLNAMNDEHTTRKQRHAKSFCRLVGFLYLLTCNNAIKEGPGQSQRQGAKQGNYRQQTSTRCATHNTYLLIFFWSKI